MCWDQRSSREPGPIMIPSQKGGQKKPLFHQIRTFPKEAPADTAKPMTIIANNIDTLMNANKLLNRIPPFLHNACSRHAKVKLMTANPRTAESFPAMPAASITYSPKAMAFPDRLPRVTYITPYIQVVRTLGDWKIYSSYPSSQRQDAR